MRGAFKLCAQMFGTLDVAANEWSDGIFAHLWRKANKDRKNFTWLVLDGPVDDIWIENLNTVMDDNCTLTLANNDRIPMLRPNVTLHFEVEDLRNASPTTVSRAGIVYVSALDLGWEPFTKSYLKRCPDDERKVLAPLFEKYLGHFVAFVHDSCAPKMVGSDIAMMTSLTSILTRLLSVHNIAVKPETPQLEVLELLERLFIFSLVWSLGGTLDQSDRAKVDILLRGVDCLVLACIWRTMRLQL